MKRENRVQSAQWARKESRWVGHINGPVGLIMDLTGCVPICTLTLCSKRMYFTGDGKDSPCEQVVIYRASKKQKQMCIVWYNHMMHMFACDSKHLQASHQQKLIFERWQPSPPLPISIITVNAWLLIKGNYMVERFTIIHCYCTVIHYYFDFWHREIKVTKESWVLVESRVTRVIKETRCDHCSL